MTQTLHSQYNQPDLEVDDLIPTSALQWKLGKVHVGESDRTVLRIVFDAIQERRKLEPELWPAKVRKQTYQAALWLHHENLREYQWVMGPH